MAMSLLLVDDDLDFLQVLRRRFSQLCLEVTAVSDPLEAMAMTRAMDFDVALIDLGLPGVSGMEVVRCLREQSAGTDVVVISGYDDPGLRLQAMQLGAASYLCKPVPMKTIEAAIANVLSMRRAHCGDSESEHESCPPAIMKRSPPGTACEEGTLFAEARHRLAAVDPRLPDCVTLELCNENLILTGRVPTYHVKQMVQESLRGLRGTMLIQNHISVFRDPPLASSENHG